MRAVWLEPDEAFLEQRRRWGADKKDEVWDGVLHMVPPPSGLHERVAHKLLYAIKPAADRLGLEVWSGTTGLFGTETNYRIPDIMIARPDRMSDRGLEGSELVVEVISPNDESRDKLPFFAKLGVREVWLVDPKRCTIEMLELVDERYLPIESAVSNLLGIEVSGGDQFRVRDGDRIVEIQTDVTLT